MNIFSKRKNYDGIEMSAPVKTGFRRLSLLVFALLTLSLCASADTETPDAASAAPPINTAADSAKNAAATTAGAKTTGDKLMTIKTPANVLELIENISEVHKSRIAFDEAFYTKENIMKITAGEDAEIIGTHYAGNKGSRIRVTKVDLRSITGDHWTYDYTACIGVSITLAIEFTINPEGKKHVNTYVNVCRPLPGLYYPAIEKLFGPWRPMKDEVYWSPTPTDIHGNKRMEYTRQDGNIVEKGFFIFGPDGLLNSIYLYAEEQ